MTNDPRFKRSPPLIRLGKWIGLWTVFGSLLYSHFKLLPPDYFSTTKKDKNHFKMSEKERKEFIEFRNEIIQSHDLYDEK